MVIFIILSKTEAFWQEFNEFVFLIGEDPLEWNEIFAHKDEI